MHVFQRLNLSRKYIRLKKFLGSDITCESLRMLSTGFPNENQTGEVPLRNDLFREPITALRGYPEDERELEQVVDSYISYRRPSVGKLRKKLVFEDNPTESKVPKFKEKEGLCTCSSEISFTETDTVGDISIKLKKLRTNHKVATVVIKVKKVCNLFLFSVAIKASVSVVH